jgi:hypothetical protein
MGGGSSPTAAPSSSAGPSTNSHKHWYERGMFIVPATLVVTLLLVGGVFHFWVVRRMREKRNKKDKEKYGDPSNKDLDYNYGLEDGTFQQSRNTERDALLGTGQYGSGANTFSPQRDNSNIINSPFSDGFDSPLRSSTGISTRLDFSPVTPSIAENSELKKASASLATAKFLDFDMGNGTVDEPGVLSRFADIMKGGVVLSLHTLKGPKPVLFSMLNGEVRWQAVKMAQKRYKLGLRDIVNIEKGKITNNFARSQTGEDAHCFSLLTSKTTLDLEASCEVDRNCLVLGFRHHCKQQSELKEGDAFL